MIAAKRLTVAQWWIDEANVVSVNAARWSGDWVLSKMDSKLDPFGQRVALMYDEVGLAGFAILRLVTKLLNTVESCVMKSSSSKWFIGENVVDHYTELQHGYREELPNFTGCIVRSRHSSGRSPLRVECITRFASCGDRGFWEKEWRQRRTTGS
jgi:hypothetical protein